MLLKLLEFLTSWMVAKGGKTSPISEVVNEELIGLSIELVKYLDRYSMEFQNETYAPKS